MPTAQLHNIVKDFAALPSVRRELLLALPGFLERHFEAVGLVATFVDGELWVLASSDDRFPVGELLVTQSGTLQVLADDRSELELGPAESPWLSAWPLMERQSRIGVLQLLRDRPLSESARLTLEIFAGLISSRLTEASRSREAAAVAELVMTLATAETIALAAERALELVAGFSDAEAGYLLQATGGQMRPIAHYGFHASEERARLLGIDGSYPSGLAWQACIERRALVVPLNGTRMRPLATPVTVVEPLGWRDNYRYVLMLRLRPRDVISSADEAAFTTLSTQLHLGLERLQLDNLQDRLMELQAHVVNADADDIYQKIMAAAVNLVPGAGAGSLLVRRDNTEPFTFRAVQGFDMEPLTKVRLTEQNMQRWYGMDREAWEAGQVRELRATDVDIDRASRASAGQDSSLVPGTEQIRSSLCLPVSFRGDVLAFLNLDNLHDTDAFGEDSVRALRMFTPVMSSMLGTLREWENIVQVAHTDALTGLPNRRGFDLALEAQLRLAEQEARQFALCVLDLKNFKLVNDTYGHAAGDEVLGMIAGIMRSNARETDTVSRWGGDEFSVLLPGAGNDLAVQVASRIRDAVAGLNFRSIELDVHVGIACYPEDATSASELLQIADARMYASKLGGHRNSRAD